MLIVIAKYLAFIILIVMAICWVLAILKLLLSFINDKNNF